MAKKMQRKFAKYWNEYSVILAMGAALDPRLKLQILRSAYDKVDPVTAEGKVDIVRNNLISLYKEYQTKSASSSNSSTTLTPHELLNESPLEADVNDDLFELESSLISASKSTKSTLEIYLDDEPRLEMKTFSDMEILSFWKENQHRYGDLASMASDLLSIPITTVASESAFSVGGRVLNPFRNRLLPQNVQALICTRNWLRGYADLEGDIEELFDEEDNDATKMASSSGVGDSNT
ncbi:zinc finger BED domain-containing protein RICESLEEPER 3-like [Arabidopsis lyrata subsp. lyrata]|uniref:zinc finger BED domain-containing protein RICESLEEPER 3-like n=1 Tax=Arabidopsis lyrata subsp. lyrata TaxID=81972 RepID=UPI000A29A71F|nr:zinc finger BED domain-containing protein RICESLEEPER 3-like [Arabidopsis lyrata subsp. lyrata]XP_020879587.1 zinc finger BED domain-containing protein RICESLEEPER 3-like [Arabidopsis lyrata subsp. lyrata]|eukprot:XP_020879586.1 zinc finger BED domain-containing protein RICESLEEPER 3-like [Arabidopsis lyrata subsp. lyrata]